MLISDLKAYNTIKQCKAALILSLQCGLSVTVQLYARTAQNIFSLMKAGTENGCIKDLAEHQSIR